MIKGSLTVFLSLIMVSVMTLIFAMSELVRLVSIDQLAQEYTDMAVESAFSEYNPYLWTNYRILAIDLGYGTENVGPEMFETKIVDYCQVNSDVEEGNNYGRLPVSSCQAFKYGLLTDKSGQPVVELGVKAAGEGLASQIIDGVQGNIDEINGVEKVEVEEQASSGNKELENAKAANAEAKRRAAEDHNPRTNPSDYPDPGSVEDDPFDAFDVLKESASTGLLSMVVATDKVSNLEIDVDNMPSARQLNVGNLEIEADTGMIDKALFIDYLMTNYSSYNNSLKHDGIQYEVEYLIAGAQSDTQNLAAVVGEILLLRETANFATIMNNTHLNLQAEAVAETLAGFTMNPAIVKAVKLGLIAAWAYAESILDLRLLLSGGKVPIVKNLDQWTSDIYHLSQIANLNTKAKDCSSGMSYDAYLMAFLALNSNETLGMRALDVMENALAQTEDYKTVKMDNMLYAAEIELSFAPEEMFLSLLDSSREAEGYSIAKRKFLTY